jgi:type I restriction-modification system DNA methylase subunit
MINRQALLADLQKFLQRIEADLLERSESTEVPEVPAALHAEYENAAKAERTAQNYEDWRTDTITQAAAAWVLSCVFVRFLEDNSLIDPPKIAGPGERLARARDEHELYFRSHPQHTDREYLLSIFAELAKLPGTKGIFGEHNAINDLPNWLSGDAAGELLNFFQKIDANTGDLVHDFTDTNWDTRFLGDLYQDLSEAARKKFALLQTPDFVEEFILDRTLDPAIEEFGLVPQPPGNEETSATRFKMIDPACGSGHFLLGSFPRLLDRWQRKEPGTNIRELTQRALDSIHGVDINPFAVAIAKIRLLLIAMKACNIQRLAEAPGFRIHVACGDSLLHGENRTSSGQRLWDYAEGATDEELYSHAYPGEDLQTVRALLKPGTYHCVVANPPYIVPKDRKLNDWYRKRFSACHMKYSLAVPFLQQIYQLAVRGGFTGQITANSFMKREFGSKLIESFLPTVDMTHVIDTSGAYIPGHGTPTTILFGRNRKSVGNTLRTVLGIRGEPSTPEEPARGLVWSSIVRLVDQAGGQNEFLSSGDSDRTLFQKHPWSIGGGGASELKELLDDTATSCLSEIASVVGILGMTNADDVMLAPCSAFQRKRVETRTHRRLTMGDEIRDWVISEGEHSLFPYECGKLLNIKEFDNFHKWLWPTRTVLGSRATFARLTYFEEGRPWWEWHQVSLDRLNSPQSIVFGEVATHNHFAFDRGGKVFNRTAPIIKLPSDATEDDHLALLGLLNSSTACFWMKQISNCKGLGGQGGGIKPEDWHRAYAFNGTKLNSFPIPDRWRECLKLARECESVSQRIAAQSPFHQLKEGVAELGSRMKRGKLETLDAYRRLVALQEDLDWLCYDLFDIASCKPATQIALENGIHPQDRPVEIALRKSIADGTKSIFYDVHRHRGADRQGHFHSEMEKVIRTRSELIETNPNIKLLETPNYKRRWQIEPWESQLERALRQWLLLRLETYFDLDGRMADKDDENSTLAGIVVPLSEIAMYSVAQLGDAARRDPQFMEVGELYRDDPAFDVQALVEELVLAESVPHLPILCYKDSGLRKRAEWEKTWDLQRREDAGESVGVIPVPPKYISADFISTGGARYWSLRGKLDVPKERWISFPHCEGPDGTLVICWAGYDHLQQAQAISAYYVRVQTEFGGSDDPRLIPLLASLIELLPWLKQWHNEPNANFDGLRMGDYFEGFVNEEARNLGKTPAEIKAWVPPKKVAKAPKAKKTKKNAAQYGVEPEG